MCPQNSKKGTAVNPCNPAHEWDPKRWQTQSPRGWENGGYRGAKPPWRGAVGGAPPQNLKGGELPALATPPRVGPKTPANPQPTGVGKTGGPGGASPHGGGLGDVPFRPNPLPPFPHREGGKFGGFPFSASERDKTLASPKPTMVGKLEGPGGRSPHGGGLGGCPPQNQKRGRVAHLSNPATSGTQNAGEP